MSKTTARASIALAAGIALLVAGCGGGSTPSSTSGSNGSTSSKQVAAADFSGKPSGSMTAEGFSLGDEVATSRSDLATARLKKDGVNVTINQGNFDSQKFAAQAASGDLPDLVAMKRNFVATYAANGLIQPLDKCYSAEKVDPKKQYYPAVLADVTYNGHIYGIPQFWQTWAVLINARVMDQAGVTPADIDTSSPDKLLAAAKKMYKEKDGKIQTLGFDPQLGTGLPGGQIGMWLLAFGGKMVDQNGKPTLDDPNNIKAWTWLKKVYDAQGGYAKVTSFIQAWDLFGAKNPYVEDQVGAGLFAQWYPNVLTPYTKQIQITGVPLKNQDGKAIAADGGEGQAYTIPTKAKNPVAACQWAITDTSDAAWEAATKARLQTVKKTPGSLFTGLFTGSSSADNLIIKNYQKPTGNKGFDETIKAYETEIQDGIGIPSGSSPAGLQIQNELLNAIVPAMTGAKSIKEALTDAQAAAMMDYKQATK